MEPQTASRLRAAGWKLPDEIPGDYVLRAYDTRIDLEWLRRILPELGLYAGDPFFVGGDFVQAGDLDEAKALAATRLTRWEPEGASPYHVVVPPRRHFARLLERARAQLPLEALGTWMTVAIVVPRAACPQKWSSEAVLQAAPQILALTQDPAMEVRVKAVGERPMMLRVPADVKELPPPKWERAQLAMDRVLLLVNFRRHHGAPLPVAVDWLRDPPPVMAASQLELLRLEYLLPPATKEASGERLLRAVVRKVSSIVAPGDITPVQLRQVQMAHGMAYALVGVPTASALAWLRCSGCENLFIRPFWTESTGAELKRDKFTLLWSKVQMAAGARLWPELNGLRGFYALYVDGKDVAIRVSAEADRAAIQARVDFVLQAATPLRSTEPGVRWWCLNPVREDELHQVLELIAATGLELARAELRLSGGPFRKKVFFPGRGEPTKLTLDGGGWTGSEAKLTKAEPPSRRGAGGAALTSQSTWAGPRTSSPPQPQDAPVQFPLAEFPTPASVAVSGSVGGGVPGGGVVISPVPTESAQGGGRGSRGGRGGRTAQPNGAPGTVVASAGVAGASSASSELAMMAVQMQAMTAQMNRMQVELRELRLENEALRRQLGSSRNVYQHDPYAPALNQRNFTTTTPVPSTSTDVQPSDPGDAAMGSGSVGACFGTPPASVDGERASGGLGAHGRDPGDTPDGKRQQRASQVMAVDDDNDA